ncbi:hypothetical protein JHK87_024311 [Glycine soja]|nr:hypothetical protein JHK87_024311 [Glycine soja]
MPKTRGLTKRARSSKRESTFRALARQFALIRDNARKSSVDANFLGLDIKKLGINNVQRMKSNARYGLQKSKETISRKFNDVLNVVMKVSKDYLNFQPYTLEGAEANKWRWFERKIGEEEGITTSLDKMANSFDRMVEKMNGKVDDEDIQEVLREAALRPDNNGLKLLNG